MFLYEIDDNVKLSNEQIQNINRANEIIIDILKNSNDETEVTIACNVAEQIMIGDKSQQLIFDALNRVFSKNNVIANKIQDDLIIHQIINNNYTSENIKIRSEQFNNKLLLILINLDTGTLSQKTIFLLKKYLVKIHKIDSIENIAKAESNLFFKRELLWVLAYNVLTDNNDLRQSDLFDEKTRDFLWRIMEKK